MPDPISTTASAVSVIDRLTALGRWITRRKSKRGYDPFRRAPLAFEVCPVKFDIDLTRAVPSIEVMFHAINYLRMGLTLRELKISRFHLSPGPVLEHIPLLQEFNLYPKNSFMVVCRRSLMDSEARAILAEREPQRWGASLSLVARAAKGRKHYEYGPVSSLAIDGWVSRPSPSATG